MIGPVRGLAIIALVVGAAACRDLLGFEDPRVVGQFPDDSRTDDAAVDSPAALCDPNLCSAFAGTCDATGVCQIGPRTGSIICPGGLRCRIACDQTCSGGIECQSGSICEVDCVGTNACQGSEVLCRASASCTVRCEGDNACEEGVTCDGSATCDLSCRGQNACGTITTGTGATCAATCCDLACNGGTGTCTIDTASCGGD